MREIKLKKEKRPQYDPSENQKSQKIETKLGLANRDVPLGGPTTVTDTTSYGRFGGKAAKQNPTKTNLEKKSDAQNQ